MKVRSHQPSKAKQLFMHVLELDSEVERAQYLENACADDPQLRQLVGELFVAASRTSPLDRVISDTKPAPRLFEDLTLKEIGPYTLMEKIGEGGMGVVYVARQQQPIRRTVALKLIKPGMDSKQVVARFEAERQALAMMNHPNIARVLDAGATETGLPYFVMELVKGLPITEYCDSHKLDLRQRLELFVQVCEAVQHAHQKGIIHRDLKPSNVLVELEDVRSVPKVIDFGVAKATQQPLVENAVYTGLSQMIGTPLYMSPEQAEYNSLDVDTRSDVYSLGVILYELITGSTPFDREILKRVGFDEMRRMIREVDPPRPSHRLSTLENQLDSTVNARRQVDFRFMSKSIRGELDWIVMKTLEKDRSRRYDSAKALAADVERYLHGKAVEACPPTLWYRSRKLAVQHKTLLLTTSAIACAMLVGTVVSVMQARRAIAAEEVAETRFEGERDARVNEQNARAEAEQAKNLAIVNASESYRQQYKAEMPLGLVDLESGNVLRLYNSLVKHLPISGREDRRGWEWYYLLSRCQEGQTLCEHYSSVSSVAWSPDGRYVATTSYDSTAIIWDARTGQRVRRFSFSSVLKRGVAWSSDSQRLAWGSVGSENAVRIWDSRTDNIQVLRGHTFSLKACSWSPDGTRLASTSMDKTARIWDTTNWKCLQVLEHTSHVNAACWLDGGKSLITVEGQGGIVGGVKVWNVESGELRRELLNGTSLSSASINTDIVPRLVVGTGDGKCILIDTDSGLVKSTLGAHVGNVSALAFSPDGSTFASGGSDGKVSIWDTSSGELIDSMIGNHGPTNSLAWNPNARQIAAGYVNGTVHLWEIPAAQQPAKLQSQFGAIKTIHWQKDGESLLAEFKSMRTVWDTSKKESIKTESFAPNSLESLSPDGRLRATATGSDGETTIFIDRIENGERVSEFTIETKDSPNLVWSPHSDRLLVWQYGRLDVWEIVSGKSLFTWPGVGIEGAAWDGDHRIAIAAGGDLTDNGYQQHMGYVHIFDVDQKIRIQKLRIGATRSRATCVSWSNDGELVAAGNGIGEVAVWNASTGKRVSYTRQHIASVKALDWTPDGRRIASVSEDMRVKIWDPATGDELLSLGTSDQPLSAVSWSNDGQRLAAGDNAGLIQIWDASTGFSLEHSDDQSRSLARIHRKNASTSYTRGDIEQASIQYSRAIELAPSRAQYRRSRAILFARTGQPQQALSDLNVALDFEPDDHKVLVTRLDLHAELGQLQKALIDAKRYDELKQDPYSRQLLAVVHLALGQEQEYRQICHSLFVGESDELLYGVEDRAWTCALVPNALTDLDRVIRVLREMIPDAPTKRLDPISLDGIGGLFYRAGHIEEAVVFLTDASRKWEQAGSVPFPSSGYDRLPAYTWYLLAMACQDLARYPESRAWYEKAEAYTQAVLAPPTGSERLTALSLLGNHSINWHQGVVLEMLQREARKVLSIPDSK